MLNIYLVKKGIRPAAQIMIHKKYLKDVEKQIKKSNIFYFLERNGKTHVYLWLFIYHHLKDIINFSSGKNYNKENVRHWVNGKLFGYSESEIGRFIASTKQELNLPLRALKERGSFTNEK